MEQFLENFQLFAKVFFEVFAALKCFLNFIGIIAGCNGFHDDAVAQDVAADVNNNRVLGAIERLGKAQDDAKLHNGGGIVFLEQVFILHPLAGSDFSTLMKRSGEGGKHELSVAHAEDVRSDDNVIGIFCVLDEVDALSNIVHKRSNAQHFHIVSWQFVEHAKLLEQ